MFRTTKIDSHTFLTIRNFHILILSVFEKPQTIIVRQASSHDGAGKFRPMNWHYVTPFACFGELTASSQQHHKTHNKLSSRFSANNTKTNTKTYYYTLLSMAVSRNSLRGFLTSAKAALRAAIDSSQKITFVIGNESAGEDASSQYRSTAHRCYRP